MAISRSTYLCTVRPSDCAFRRSFDSRSGQSEMLTRFLKLCAFVDILPSEHAHTSASSCIVSILWLPFAIP